MHRNIRSPVSELSVSRRNLLLGSAAASVLAPMLPHAGRPVFAQDGALPPGPAADIVTFGAYNVDQAPLNIENGDIDLYLFGLKTAGADSLEGSDEVRMISAPASTVSLILNPAPGAEGTLNPFSIPEVRYAMQFLIDREFIANNIYQGRALPMLTNISPLDYDQLTIFPVLSDANITHNADVATQQITAAMEAAGATKDGDLWTFDGSPILVKIITRVEDERRDIGDLVRVELENIGFQVQPIYQQFGPATLAVYASDPLTFEWHVYTEGWGRSAPVRYDDSGINQFAAPWLGNMPGWQVTGFWQYENEQLDTIGKQLYRGEFQSQDERNSLYQEMAGLALQESVRVWLVTALQNFPVRNDVENLTEDVVAGPRNPFALRGAIIPGRTDLKVGNLWVWTERSTWNPVGGYRDVYSNDIAKNINDPAMFNHPFTGLPQAYRADFVVETAGPDGTLEVPPDAVLWDAAADAWAPVGDGVVAKSRVSFDYSKFLEAPWHHGQPITMADVVYPIAQGYEIAFDENKVQIETALGITSRPLYETFRGYRYVAPASIEVYVDYWHFEDSYIASYALPSSVGTPWEILFAMDDAVFEKRQAAFTDTTAARFSVPWISLVTESDARLVIRSLREFKRGNTLPAGVFEMNGEVLATAEEAVARYDACEAWFDETNLLMIANGPFQLTRYDPPAQFAQLDAYRHESYPFTAEDVRFGTPPTIEIPPVSPPTLVLGDPVTVPVQVNGPGELALQYTLVDPSQGVSLVTASADGGDGGAFTVSIDPTITEALFPGIYQLFLLGSSTDIAQVAQQRVDLEIGL